MKQEILPDSCVHKSEQGHLYTLGISIPTYNRAARLSRSLDDLRNIIIKCELKNYVSIYVTDNGSTDNTKNILLEQERNFERDGISFSHESIESNRGFDNNIMRCFNRGPGDYCWFISDDDNLEEDALNNILKDINEFTPNLIIYNFDQEPYSKSSPLISKKHFVIDSRTDFGFVQLIKMAKLTSLIIKRSGEPLQSEVFKYDKVISSGFLHIALAMQTAYHYGRILLSNNFCAKPDSDFRDHIDFPPYVGNRYNDMVKSLFHYMNKPEWFDLHSIPNTDVGVSAMEWLIDYHKGRAVVPFELRLELRRGIKEYVEEYKFSLLLHPKFIRRCIYLSIAWLKWLILEKVFHLRITKQRKNVCEDTER